MKSHFQRLTTRLRFIHRGMRYRYRVEAPEVRFVLNHLRPGQSAIDIGAHKGAFTYWISKRVGNAGRVFAFEPIPMLADYLRHVKQVFPLANLSVQQAALSDREERRTLHIPKNNYIGTSSFTPTENPHGHDEQPVTTYRLDTFLRSQGSPHIDFIKCDVEGHELDVLHGSEETLQRCHPIMLMECEDVRNGGGQLQRVRDYLSGFGYGCFVMDGFNLRPYEQFIDTMRESGKRIGVDAWRNFVFA